LVKKLTRTGNYTMVEFNAIITNIWAPKADFCDLY
jgi:hypothetical protein